MTNEITTNTKPTELETSTLKKATNKISTMLARGRKLEKDIVKEVYRVHTEGLPEKCGFKNTAEWALKFFGWDKSKCSRMVNVAARFEQSETWEQYSLSQMVTMLNVPEHQLANFTSDMTVMEMRELAHQLTAKPTIEKQEQASEPEPEQKKATTKPEPEPEPEPADTYKARFDTAAELKKCINELIKKHVDFTVHNTTIDNKQSWTISIN